MWLVVASSLNNIYKHVSWPKWLDNHCLYYYVNKQGDLLKLPPLFNMGRFCRRTDLLRMKFYSRYKVFNWTKMVRALKLPEGQPPISFSHSTANYRDDSNIWSFCKHVYNWSHNPSSPSDHHLHFPDEETKFPRASLPWSWPKMLSLCGPRARLCVLHYSSLPWPKILDILKIS